MKTLVYLLLLSLSATASGQTFYTFSTTNTPYTPLQNPVVLQQSPFPFLKQYYTITPGFGINFFNETRYSFKIGIWGQILFSEIEYLFPLHRHTQIVDRGNTKIQYEIDTSDCKNRVVKIELENAGFTCDTTLTEKISLQIWLYQNGTIKMHYGSSFINSPKWANCHDIYERISRTQIKSGFMGNYYYQLGGDPLKPYINCHNCKKDTFYWLYNIPPTGTEYTFSPTQTPPPYLAINTPFTNELRIQYQGYCAPHPPQNHKATLWNMEGKKVYDISINNNSTSVNTTALPTGVYYLEIKDQQNTPLLQQKVLKN